MTSDEKKAGMILFGIAATEGTWVAVNLSVSGQRFWRYMGLTDPLHAGALAWVLAAVTAALFAYTGLALPSVRKHLWGPPPLKFLAVLVAMSAALCEEGVFRKLLMDGLREHGSTAVIQVLASAVAFGFVHGVWGLFKGSFRGALAAIAATGALGGALGMVYLVGHRVLAPCVLAHLIINLLLEPGLVLAAVRGEMGARLAKTPRAAGF